MVLKPIMDALAVIKKFHGKNIDELNKESREKLCLKPVGDQKEDKKTIWISVLILAGFKYAFNKFRYARKL